jgi:hypothetical protein
LERHRLKSWWISTPCRSKKSRVSSSSLTWELNSSSIFCGKELSLTDCRDDRSDFPARRRVVGASFDPSVSSNVGRQVEPSFADFRVNRGELRVAGLVTGGSPDSALSSDVRRQIEPSLADFRVNRGDLRVGRLVTGGTSDFSASSDSSTSSDVSGQI